MVNVYIILTGLITILLESSLITWPWFLLYSFWVLRSRGTGWVGWLIGLSVVLDILAFRYIGLGGLMVVGLVLVERYLASGQINFWLLEPLGILMLLAVWCWAYGQSAWVFVTAALIFGATGFMVRGRSHFISLR